ncbi:preprotein translocase subunit SecA [Chitinivibrio alkaliphilus]|uniref:Protein translocase subunit SecA n=1 Tax=Chitinivibrio alkaliphilus ACht1 TaxID=1313304 RepID=U7D2Y5_9BACT|nr:preprotein translocase subunit SecA [Chitinivibrio alkaliphilus]ERP30839.1 preprotein translocase, SecA subunit [Chitinivibrio alkaliphilus ACht1]
MAIIDIVAKVVGTKQDKDLKKLRPLLQKVNTAWEDIKPLSDTELQGKTEEFRRRLREGETLDSLLFEAFAVVREATHRILGNGKVFQKEDGTEVRFMAHFDVQVLAAIVLHQGKIAEMKTGEGKTQVAPMAAYLNALPEDKSVHVVTVNDYLAKRDSEWMGQIFRFLGLTVGCIDSTAPGSSERKAAYACDIVYGTNNEFGFDYLRDNMAVRKENLVQSDLNFAIIDEVDNILIDEARTPLIISGPSDKDNSQYINLEPLVRKLIAAQKQRASEIFKKLETHIAEKRYDRTFGELMLTLKRAVPKDPRFLELIKDKEVDRVMKAVEGEYLREKKLHLLNEELFFAIDESGNSTEMTEMGRELISGSNTGFFVLPDLSVTIGEIDAATDMTPEEKNLAREKAHQEYAEQAEKIHCVTQLLRAHAMFEKDVDYVVRQGKVEIVDEFTGRIMSGRRYSDGLHQALEAKEGVQVAGESQTLANITFQNFFKMYDKVAGMTGTAVTEAKEFIDIYELDVVQIPTNKPIIRNDYDDQIYKTPREKYNAVVAEIQEAVEAGRPTLVGTISIEKSEYLGSLLKKAGVAHEVLNAKNHAREASIVAQAGRKGAVTIATNMAGRGTDIKLGGNFEELAREKLLMDGEDPDAFSEEDMKNRYPELHQKVAEEKMEVLAAGGLQVIGTERHESRRIDNQLRGRSGRQGDPGLSRFYLSLDDDLMRIFGSERIAGLMDKMGLEEGEVISHGIISSSVSRAQRKVEGRNFEIRKHLKEYDDVMNMQRKEVYALRKTILLGEDIAAEINDQFGGALEAILLRHTAGAKNPEEWDFDKINEEMARTFGIVVSKEEYSLQGLTVESLFDSLWGEIRSFYQNKEERIGADRLRELERNVALMVIDEKWKKHLFEMDHLRDEVQYRSFGQKKPLFEYQKEGLLLFEQFREDLAVQISSMLFRIEVVERPRPNDSRPVKESHSRVNTFASRGDGAKPKPQQLLRTHPKVGRNDPCPCGSGRKYKKCCGK